MFQLTKEEYDSLKSQIVILKPARGQHSKYLPYAFTEHGTGMVASILNTPQRLKCRKLFQMSPDEKAELDTICDQFTNLRNQGSESRLCSLSAKGAGLYQPVGNAPGRNQSKQSQGPTHQNYRDAIPDRYDVGLSALLMKLS